MSDGRRDVAYQMLLNRPPTEQERVELISGALNGASLEQVAEQVAASREHLELAASGNVNVLAGSAAAEANLPPGTSSGDPDSVGFDAVVGEEGRMFIAHGANDFLSQYRGSYPLPDRWEGDWLGLLAAQDQSALRLGVRSVGLVIPDKLAVYPDQFPAQIGDGAARPIRRLLGRGADLLYPLEELQEARATSETYLLTDSHVSLFGAEVLYRSVMESLGMSPAARISESDHDAYLAAGDLGLKFKPVAVEVATVGPPLGVEIVANNAQALLDVGGHIGIRQVVRNDQARLPETVVIFGDSYCRLDAHALSGLGGFLARDFAEVHFVWAPFCWDSGYVEASGATIVIRQMAERFAVITPKAETDVAGLADETIRRKSAVFPAELSTGLRPLNICTIIARNYLAQARVLAESFSANHPGGKCVLLVVDDEDGLVGDVGEPFTVVNVADLEVEEFDRMKAAYGVTELSTAVKPWLLRYMLKHYDTGGGVAYLDPDIQLFSRMLELEEALSTSSLVLTPHLTAPIPRDGHTPAEANILTAGTYNLGFIGLKGTEQSQELLDWWGERLVRDCVIDPERGLFVDQRWVDLIPGLFPDFVALRNPGYNVAYWNLPARTVTETGSGFEVDGQPLRFFHFSGFDANKPDRLSQHQSRIVLREQPVLAQLCLDYAEALKAAGALVSREDSYAYNALPSGMQMNDLLRGLYRDGSDLGEVPDDLLTMADEAEFVAWLNEPAEMLRGNGSPHYTRYLDAIWECRPDLKSAYPDPSGADAGGFNGWCWVFGRPEVPIDDRLLPPEPRGLAGGGGSVGNNSPRRKRPRGVNVAGYFRAELGVGEAARQLVGALDAADVLSDLVVVDAPASRQEHAYGGDGAGKSAFPVNIICVNADSLPQFAADAGEEFFDDRYSVGVWWWELDQFPDRFHNAFTHLDEIWVGSRFVADAIAPVSPIPVIVMPVALDFSEPEPLAAGEFGWPGGFSFLYSYDYNSVFERKNPLGAIEAFRSAFEPSDGAFLVIKSINADRDPGNHQRVVDAAAGRPDIVLIDDYLTADDKNRLAASCDCYVSLHRSEGFGLTIAEAMYFGKPVIATGYGGNLEFMDATNSQIVPYEMVRVGPNNDPYPSDGEWAQPDLEQAAALMRETFDDQSAARERGRRGQASIRRAHSPQAAGRAIIRRLARISSRLESRELEMDRSAGGSNQLAAMISTGHLPTSPSRFGKLGAALRRLVFRVTRPITSYQERVNQRLLELISAEASTATERSATLAAKVRNLERRLAESERLADQGEGAELLASSQESE